MIPVDRDLRNAAYDIVISAVLGTIDQISREGFGNITLLFWLFGGSAIKMRTFIGWLNHAVGIELSDDNGFFYWSVRDFTDEIAKYLANHPDQPIQPIPTKSEQPRLATV